MELCGRYGSGSCGSNGCRVVHVSLCHQENEARWQKALAWNDKHDVIINGFIADKSFAYESFAYVIRVNNAITSANPPDMTAVNFTLRSYYGVEISQFMW